MTPSLQATSQEMRTHRFNRDLDLDSHRKRLMKKDNLVLPFSETMELLREVSSFDLGRFLLKNGGLNGHWTSYLILEAPQLDLQNPLEHWLVYEAPVVKATRERFYIFQEHMKKYIPDTGEYAVASIPCGTMEDLLSLKVVNPNIKYCGIDLDNESLEWAIINAKNHHKAHQLTTLKKDAWNLDINNAFNLITSNGLNIYEPNEEKVIALYQEFYQALKPGGILITSFLTPPPQLHKKSPWKKYNAQDAKKQAGLFRDVLQAKFQSYRTESQTREHLTKAGFGHLEFIYDTQAMFPTVVARKG